ncbi:uncharacterized protein [Montipora foliosa]|uniref:uncharacterized protein n=1 Tax=Montipora foliosa TaxID=591990 RepID=UPI0035F12262
MHNNSNIAFQTQETDAQMTAVLEVHLRLANAGSCKTSDEIVYELAESIVCKLAATLDMSKAGKAMFDGRLKGDGSQDLGNHYEGTRCVVEEKTLKKIMATRECHQSFFSCVTVKEKRNPRKITYRGRVTDACDKRCLTAILGRFLSLAILKDGYRFSSSDFSATTSERHQQESGGDVTRAG